MQKIRKAVIPAAGFGTRFLPATKAMPKEMLPVVDKPIIQYVVEEAVAAGIEDIIIVTGWHKRSIEDHFDVPFELEQRLREAGKTKEADDMRRIADLANFIYVRQKGPYGNGTPVLCARHVIGDEPFAVLWGDEFMQAEPNRLSQLMAAWEQTGSVVVSTVKITDPGVLSNYGVPDVEPQAGNLYKIKGFVEKPAAGQAPSSLAITGGYVLPAAIFDLLAKTPVGKNNELWLIDAINALRKQQDVYALEIQNGTYYDTGNKLEYLKAIVSLGLQHSELKADFGKFLKNLPLN